MTHAKPLTAYKRGDMARKARGEVWMKRLMRQVEDLNAKIIPPLPREPAQP